MAKFIGFSWTGSPLREGEPYQGGSDCCPGDRDQRRIGKAQGKSRIRSREQLVRMRDRAANARKVLAAKWAEKRSAKIPASSPDSTAKTSPAPAQAHGGAITTAILGHD